jgi:hypothetical protein
MMEKKIKQVCKCENCGNEAEMTITCSFVPEESASARAAESAALDEAERKGKTKGHAVCGNCGSEADMWLDM